MFNLYPGLPHIGMNQCPHTISSIYMCTYIHCIYYSSIEFWNSVLLSLTSPSLLPPSTYNLLNHSSPPPSHPHSVPPISLHIQSTVWGCDQLVHSVFLLPADTGGLPGLPGRDDISLVLSSNVRVAGGEVWRRWEGGGKVDVQRRGCTCMYVKVWGCNKGRA